MTPNIHFHEQLIFERAQGWQREIEKQHLLASLRKTHASQAHLLIGRLGTLFMVLGIRMKQLEQKNESSN